MVKVKELKEKLDQFPDNMIVLVAYWDPYSLQYDYLPVTNIFRGVNEADRCVFIDAYEEEDI